MRLSTGSSGVFLWNEAYTTFGPATPQWAVQLHKRPSACWATEQLSSSEWQFTSVEWVWLHHNRFNDISTVCVTKSLVIHAATFINFCSHLISFVSLSTYPFQQYICWMQHVVFGCRTLLIDITAIIYLINWSIYTLALLSTIFSACFLLFSVVQAAADSVVMNHL